MRTMVVAVLLAVCASAGSASADPACLPSGVKPDREGATTAMLELGLVGGTPVACARGGSTSSCWQVDAKTGGLTPRATLDLPGHSVHVTFDAKGCAAGFCGAGKSGDSGYLATSTDSAHVAIAPQAEGAMTVFDAKTKKIVKTIADAGSQSVSDVAYVGNTIYVTWSDAGPYASLQGWKDDGTKLGQLGGDGFSVYMGSVSPLDDARVALADAGMENVVVVTAKDGRATNLKRPVKAAPCTKKEMGAFTVPVDPISKKCQAHLDKAYWPYVGASIVALADGTFLAALTHRSGGDLVILDGKKLTERKRFHAKVCAK